MSYYLQIFLKLYVSQAKKLSQFLLLSCYYFALGIFFCTYFNSPFSRSSSTFKEFSSGSLVVGSSLIQKATRCHSLSLVIPLAVIGCHSFYHSFHSLSIVVTRCITCLSFHKWSCCSIIEAYNWIYWLPSFKMCLVIVCNEIHCFRALPLLIKGSCNK